MKRDPLGRTVSSSWDEVEPALLVTDVVKTGPGSLASQIERIDERRQTGASGRVYLKKGPDYGAHLPLTACRAADLC